jgi:uncharacterized membrane protein
MNALLPWLAERWFPAAVLLLALACGATLALLRRRRPGLALFLGQLGAALALLAVGGLALMPRPAFWLLAAAGGVLLAALALLLLTGGWSRPLAFGLAALGLVALGGLGLRGAGEGLVEAGRSLLGLRVKEPWWLALLALLPVLVALSWRRLTRSEFRPWASLALRCALVALLALALAEPFLAQPSKNLTVLFVVDRSLSVPEELGPDPADETKKIDLRLARIQKFINDAVKQRGRGHARDKAGLIVFGRRPRLELPPSDAPRFNLLEIPAAEDGNYTDIGAALKLGLASFPEGTGKRIVLISDGNENLGNAEEQARLARSLGAQIDVLPLAAGQRNEDEVLVERVDAPPVIEGGAVVPIRVLVRSFNPNVVIGRLTLKQSTVQFDKDVKEEAAKVVGVKPEVPLQRGLNVFEFVRPPADKQRSYSYEAEFFPLRVQDKLGPGARVLPGYERGLPNDRVQNNRATAHVVARGEGRILLLENERGKHTELVKYLRAAGEAGKHRFKVVAEPVDVLDNYKERDRLAVFLSNFDCVILANVPADRVSEEQQEAIRSNTHDQGCGLVVIGGPDSFGAGGWQNTPVEKALPVDCDIKSLKVQGKGGLVLIMHASEMADGNKWQKKIAKLAVERLGPIDEVGVLDFGFGVKWHVPMQEVGPNRAKILAAIDNMTPGDMPDFDPALKMAHAALMDRTKNFAVKHIIIISDGDPVQNDKALLKRIKADKITIATVGVATHGPAMDRSMEDIASSKSRYYKVDDPRKLPAIYIKETRLVSQSFVHEQTFNLEPAKGGPVAGLKLPALDGYVRTTPKPSPLVEVALQTPRFKGADVDFPILAYWHYGLGKAVAFTSDAAPHQKFWSKRWLEAGAGGGAVFARFWEQVLAWSLRPVETGRLQMTTEYRDGKVKVTVEARTVDGKPDTNLRLRAGITAPSSRAGAPKALRFVQKNSGVYEAEVKAEEAGSYFITAQATRTRKVKRKGPDGKEREVEVEEGQDSVRSGVTLPYSPEFSEMETNAPLLERLRDITEGMSYQDDDEALAEAVRAGLVYRRAPERVKSSLPFHNWLLFLAGGLLFLDVAVRRLALDPDQVSNTFEGVWARLRGFPAPPPLEAAAVGRLRARRGPADDAVTARAGRRFEGGPVYDAPLGADATAPIRPPAPRAGERPEGAAPGQPEAQPGGGLDRLFEAKKKVWEERGKDKPE